MAIAPEFDIGKFFSIVRVDNKRELDILEDDPVSFNFDRIDRKFRIKDKHIGRPDLIANEALGDPVFWWIILVHNDIFDPFTELSPGDEIEIPLESEIFSFIQGLRKRG